MCASKIPLIQTLDTISPEDIEIHGGKATNIARLNRAGFCIPRGFSISSRNFIRMINETPEINKLLDRLKEVDDFEEILVLADKLQTLVNSYQMAEDLKSEISREFQRLQKLQIGSEWGYAVRSSATIEDRHDIRAAPYMTISVNDTVRYSIEIWFEEIGIIVEFLSIIGNKIRESLAKIKSAGFLKRFGSIFLHNAVFRIGFECWETVSIG